VALHIGIIFGTLVLLTGPIWAKVSWGHWWNWSDEQLNVFLILFLFYSAYFMLRFSLDPGPQRAAYSSAYALLGIGLVPLSFVAVHLAKSLIHPVVFTSNGPQMDNPMLTTFLVWWAGILSLGFVIASLVPTARFAQPISAAVLYPMMFLSGLFFPVDRLPRTLAGLAYLFPTTHAVALLNGVWDGSGWEAHWVNVAALFALFIAYTALSTRVFRWE